MKAPGSDTLESRLRDAAKAFKEGRRPHYYYDSIEDKEYYFTLGEYNQIMVEEIQPQYNEEDLVKPITK